MTAEHRGPSPEQLEALRACHGRQLEREGVPMVLGIVDERRPIPRNTDEAQLAEGAGFERMLRDNYDGLVPWARPDDEGALIVAMQIVAHARFPATSELGDG